MVTELAGTKRIKDQPAAAATMAADLEVSSVIPTMVSTRRLEGTLVAPEVKKPLPDHLTDTSKPVSNHII